MKKFINIFVLLIRKIGLVICSYLGVVGNFGIIIVLMENVYVQAFFGVFDGHGGNKAAEYASKNMEKNIMDEVRKGSGEGIEEAVRKGYLATDVEFLKEESSGGSCCATALIRNGELVVSNAGDCRVVMSRGGVAEALTDDHRPSRKDEKERIEKLVSFM